MWTLRFDNNYTIQKSGDLGIGTLAKTGVDREEVCSTRGKDQHMKAAANRDGYKNLVVRYKYLFNLNRNRINLVIQ